MYVLHRKYAYVSKFGLMIFPFAKKMKIGPTEQKANEAKSLFYTVKSKNTSGNFRAQKMHSGQQKNKKQVGVSSLVNRGRHSPS